jgi:trk system potassium uptake protein
MGPESTGSASSNRLLPPWFTVFVGLVALIGVLADFGFNLSPNTHALIQTIDVFLFGILVAGVLLPEAVGKNRLLHARKRLLEIAVLLYILVEVVSLFWVSPVGNNWQRIVLATQAYWILRLLGAVVQAHEILLKKNLPPLWILVGGYVCLISAGTGLLMLPACQSTSHAPWRVSDALFTAVSAACVTGLSTRDIGSELTTRGQLVVLGLIQVGGLGLVTYVMFISFLHQRSVQLKQMLAWRDMLGLSGVGELRRFIAYVLVITLVVELTGAVILASLGTDPTHALGERLWWGAFHAVSAFNNAGFALQSNSLEGFRGSSAVLLTVCGLVIAGGLGFPVLQELLRMRPSRLLVFRRIAAELGWRIKTPLTQVSLHAKIALTTTVLLLIIGTVLFYLAESRGVLAEQPARDALVSSFFHAAIARTAGFAAVNIGQLQDYTLFLLMLLMAVGAAPLSTGGGVKVTTLAVVYLTVRAMFRAREHVEAFGRTIPRRMVNACVALFAIYGVAIVTVVTLLMATQDGLHFRDLLFESISALSTTGLSTGITAQCNDLGKSILCVAMFVGRVGPLTVLWVVLSRSSALSYSYPHEDLLAS